MQRWIETFRALAPAVGLGLIVALGYSLYQSRMQLATQEPLQLVTLAASERSMSTPPPGSYREAVQTAAPAVVNIHTALETLATDHPLLNDPLMRQYLNTQPQRDRRITPLGSGVIVSAQGHVLTNHHVIANAPRLIVELRDGRSAIAELVGSDPESDLAVLKIQLTNPPVIPIAQSPSLIGDSVLAIGNPFGVGQSVTKGILSATGRIAGLTVFEDFIQTDAAINPGNSGGALVNIFGELIGINSAIFTRGGGSQGIAFAIPTSLALDVMQQLITHGRVIRGFIGIEVEPMSTANSQALGVAGGLLITAVYRESPAEAAGLEPQDVLIGIDQKPVINGRSAMLKITGMNPGESAELTVLRGDQQLSLPITIGLRPRAR